MRKNNEFTEDELASLEKDVHKTLDTSIEKLDKIAEKYIINEGAKPAFLRYEGFPCSICGTVSDHWPSWGDSDEVEE